MKVTFTCKDLHRHFWETLEKMSPVDQYKTLVEKMKYLQISRKIGDGSFRDSVDFDRNSLSKSKVGKRKGYVLVTIS